MTRYFKALPFTAVALLAALVGRAQEQATSTATTGAIRQIPVSDQMFRKTIWRAIDLREKQNRPMFSEGKEVSRAIIEAVKRGELQAYKNDSLASTYTPQEMRGKTSYEEEILDVPGGSDNWGAPGAAPGARPAAAPRPANDGWGITPPAAPVAAARTERRPRRDARGRIMRDRRGNTLYERVAAAAPVAVVAPPTTNLQPYRYKDLYQM